MARDMQTAQEAPGQRPSSAWTVLRRGIRETPELRSGLAFTAVLALAGAAGRLAVPIAVQQIIDRGLLGPEGFRPRVVYPACALTVVMVAAVYACQRLAFARLVVAAENALRTLRVRAFAHIHRLSIAEQTETRRGTFVARVTTDVDTITEFIDWGGISWITSLVLMSGCLAVMCVYSWELTLAAVLAILPVVAVLRLLQRGLLASYDRLRTRISETLGEASESIMGAATIRAYGAERRVGDRLEEVVKRQYGAELKVARFTATIFPITDLFGAVAVATVVGLGAVLGPRLGLSLGGVIALVFLVTLLVGPLTELSEVFDTTQTAIAGWRKVLSLIDLPVEVEERDDGLSLPAGALELRLEEVGFSYRDGIAVLGGVTADVPACAHVAVVGETGSGKSTLAKLLCRLADPTEGRILLGGVDLRDVSPAARRAAIRLVPQDGFLFDGTVLENIAQGRPGATAAEVEAAIDALGLRTWVSSLERGLETRVGERGDSLSVGERQLVALARAQVGGCGLLVLDEATSAVDPETELALSTALERLGEGRTTVTIAHRLSTAIAADAVLVLDRGRLVERGTHAELIAAGGVYAALYSSWLGNTAAAVPIAAPA